MKSFAVSVLVAFVLMQTPLHQLAKLPALFQHYSSHISSNPECGFFEFISEHYGSAEHHGDMNEEDERLPFKVYEFTGSFVQAVLPGFTYQIFHIFHSTVAYLIPLKLQLFESPGLDSHFQPPCCEVIFF
jgi:hypothetical protein